MVSRNKELQNKTLFSKAKLTKISVIFFLILTASYLYFNSIVGSLVLNLVDGSTDDTIISHAISWATPELFKNDFRSANFAIETPTSMINLVPGLALKYFGIDPLNFYLFFLVIQILLLPVAVFKLARVFNVSNKNSIILTLIFLIVRPQYWNFAWIGDLDWMPYASWLALPCFILYVTSKLQFNDKKSYIFLLLGIACHPTFGALILFFDLIWETVAINYKTARTKSLLKNNWRNFTYIFSGLYLLCNFIYIRSKSAKPIPRDYIDAIIGNNHFNAVVTSPSAITWRTSFTALILIITLMAIIGTGIKLISLKNQNRSLLPSLLITLLITTLLQLIAIRIDHLTLLRIMFTRFSIFFVSIVFIYAVSILMKQKLNPVQIITYVLFILFPGELSLCLIMINLVVFRIRLTRKFIAPHLLGLYFIFFVLINQSSRLKSIILNMFSPTYNELNIINLLRSKSPYGNLLTDRFTVQFLTLTLIIISTYVYLLSTTILKFEKRYNSLQSTVIVVLLFSGLILGRELETSIRHNTKTESLLEVQKWAKINTKPGTVFMGYDWSTYLGWRTFSRRGMMYITDCGSSPYFYSKSDAQCQKLQDLVLSTTQNEIEEIQKISKLTRIHYILKRANQELPLKIVYQNKDYIVYDSEIS